MTRRRIIAGVILLAAVAVAVPLVQGLWWKAWVEFAYYEVVLDQVCPACRLGTHTDCFPAVGRGANCMWGNIVVDFPPDFRCTCTDPSHDGER